MEERNQDQDVRRHGEGRSPGGEFGLMVVVHRNKLKRDLCGGVRIEGPLRLSLKLYWGALQHKGPDE